jgi:hypothetical protein
VTYEVDQAQDGRLRLRRRVLVTQHEGEVYSFGLSFAVDGMAGAVSFGVISGNHRSGRAAQPHGDDDGDTIKRPLEHGPVGCVTWAEQCVTTDLAPGGLSVHAYRPWPREEQDVPAECPFLHGGRCFEQQLEGGHQDRSTELLRRLANPGGVEFVWEYLERTYREEFAPALSMQELVRQRREEGATLAEATQRGAERAAQMAGPPLLFIDRAALAEGGLEAAELLTVLHLDGLWLPPEVAQARGLVVPQVDLPGGADQA